ncbi:MAG: hypothetical protein BroJett009_05790 [Armatimonadota bacterium]|nr:MAG: hypothetical protein BroJett009_05790 [Armatimonadota bacterium]
MPIQRLPEACDHPIQLCSWTATDLDRLAEIIAWLLLGRYAHVEAILSGGAAPAPALSNQNIDEAIGHLTCPNRTRIDEHNNEVPSNCVVHRDGWLFQFMSWVVSQSEFPGSLLKAPQARKADKGFDGLLLQLNDSALEFVLMLEDKATDDPRKTVRDKIWPEFKTFEEGLRDNELTAEATTMLKQVPNLDPAEITRTANWFREKRYRASVAASESNLPAEVHTFEGYDGVVNGAFDRRLANLFISDNMRDFFEDLAQRAITSLEAKRPD